VAVVLDNEPVRALAEPRHRKHRRTIAALDAVAARNGRRPGSTAGLVPTAVRVEAAIDRRAVSAAALGRHRVVDVPLDAATADLAATLRSHGSTIDACLAAAAASTVASRVLVLTSDPEDIARLVAALDAAVAVHRL
jgi:hypothetical protein